MELVQKIISKILIICLLLEGRYLSALTIGNFTAQDYRILIKDNKQKFLVDNFLIKEQHYVDLGAVSDDQLPLTLSIWEKDETKLDDSTILSEFIIEHVPSLKIEVLSSDMWIFYSDENNELQITNLAKQVSGDEKPKPIFKADLKFQPEPIIKPELGKKQPTASEPKPELQAPKETLELKREPVKGEEKPKVIQLQAEVKDELVEKVVEQPKIKPTEAVKTETEYQPKKVELQEETIPLVPLEQAKSPNKK